MHGNHAQEFLQARNFFASELMQAPIDQLAAACQSVVTRAAICRKLITNVVISGFFLFTAESSAFHGCRKPGFQRDIPRFFKTLFHNFPRRLMILSSIKILFFKT